MKRFFGPSAIGLLTAAALVMTTGQAWAGQKAEVGKKAPDFTLKDQTGKPVSLSDFRGKIVVLEWTNDGCPVWRRHHTEGNQTMIRLAKKYRDKGVVWLGINSTKSAGVKHNKQLKHEYDLPYPVLDDSSGKVGRMYGAKTTPHMYVINKKGVLVYNGAIDSDSNGNQDDPTNYVAQAIEDLLAGRDVQVPKTQPYGCSVKYAK